MPYCRWVVFAFLGLLLCRTSEGDPPSAANLRLTTHVSSRKDQVRECVYRYQFSTFGLADKDYNKHFFVGIGYQPKADASPDVITRLQSSAYSVKGVSQCTRTTSGVNDTKTKAKGLAFFVTKITFVSAQQAQVEASVFKNEKSGNQAIYTVNNSKGCWKVVKCEITDVS